MLDQEERHAIHGGRTALGSISGDQFDGATDPYVEIARDESRIDAFLLEIERERCAACHQGLCFGDDLAESMEGKPV
jgi:hypothetical protein